MSYITKEQFEEMQQNGLRMTASKLRKAKDLQKKIRSLSREELKAFLLEPDKENE